MCAIYCANSPRLWRFRKAPLSLLRQFRAQSTAVYCVTKSLFGPDWGGLGVGYGYHPTLFSEKKVESLNPSLTISLFTYVSGI